MDTSPYAPILQALLLAKVISEERLKDIMPSFRSENVLFVDMVAEVNVLLRDFDLELASVEDHWTGDCYYGIV